MNQNDCIPGTEKLQVYKLISMWSAANLNAGNKICSPPTPYPIKQRCY
jgi:hypothetical protein